MNDKEEYYISNKNHICIQSKCLLMFFVEQIHQNNYMSTTTTKCKCVNYN